MTGVMRRVVIEATGGHHELSAVVKGVLQSVETLRIEAARDGEDRAMPVTISAFNRASINLEGTIRVETEDDL